MVSTGHGILRNSSPSKGRSGLRIVFIAFVPYFLGESLFSKVAPLVLPQLTIMIAFYDLRRCSGSILSSPIPQDDYLDYIYLIIN